MEHIAELNEALAQLMHNKSFMDRYQRLVIQEQQKPLPIWQALDIFAQLATEEESVLEAAPILVNIECPTIYLLIDVLTIYIKKDSRFEPIRQSIPFC